MFLLGIWRNFDELENELTIDELNLLLETMHKKEEAKMRFQAALQGHDLGGQEDSEFERVKQQAQDKLNAINGSAILPEQLGIHFESED